MALFRRAKRRASRRKKSETNLVWQFVYGFLAISLVVLVGYATWYVTRLPEFTIEAVRVSGGETVSHDEILTVVEQELAGSYLLLIPKRFTYLYPHDRIVEKILEDTRIYNLRVQRAGRNELEVSFDEHFPYALWCSVEGGVLCLFINEEGFAFAQAPALEGGTFVRYYSAINEPAIGAFVTDGTILREREAFIDVLRKELDIRINAVIETSDGDVTYLLSGGGELRTSPGVGVQETFENLQSVLQSEEYAHIAPGNFNYIDLRFGNKVFVNEVLTSKENATGTIPAARVVE